MIKVCLIGASGKMGRAVIEEVNNQNDKLINLKELNQIFDKIDITQFKQINIDYCNKNIISENI